MNRIKKAMERNRPGAEPLQALPMSNYRSVKQPILEFMIGSAVI
jgi:hypothetical protein